MQNVQNAAEIQQRVINLVELYRIKVGKESQIAKDAKADCDYWDKENEKMAMEALDTGDFFIGSMHGEGPHTEVWIKRLKVNEQLLGHFYAEVLGENAERDVIDQLLADVYDVTSGAKDGLIKLSPFYPHGGIPVPFSVMIGSHSSNQS